MNLVLPHIILPKEFLSLLKSSIQLNDSSELIFQNIRPNKALYSILETAFDEFNDGRGLEKLMVALGWPNFRDRIASVYISKSIFGCFPTKTSLELIEDIRKLENRFLDNSVHSHSRVFLLGFYIKMSNLLLKDSSDDYDLLQIPQEIDAIVKISRGRSDRLDWIILIVMHFAEALGRSIVFEAISTGKSFDILYSQLSEEKKKQMHFNFLAYSASIEESDIFVFEKV